MNHDQPMQLTAKFLERVEFAVSQEILNAAGVYKGSSSADYHLAELHRWQFTLVVVRLLRRCL